jgi:hypothetical protein
MGWVFFQINILKQPGTCKNIKKDRIRKTHVAGSYKNLWAREG